MRIVYKYKLSNTLELPVGAWILNVDFQGEELCLWALVDPKRGMEKRFFMVLPTGFLEIPDDVNVVHLKTLIHEGYVWHIFENLRQDVILGVSVTEGHPG